MQKEVPANQSGDYESLHQSNVSLRRQVDHLSTLRQIALAINGIELDQVLPPIADVVQGELEVRRFAIILLDRDRATGTPVIAKYGRDLITRERLEEEVVQIHGTPLGEAIDTRMPIIVNTDYESQAFVPLIARENPVGIMRLEDRRDASPFSKEDLPLLQDISSLIAIAIDNAQLYSLAVNDGLTGLYVRRYFDLRMDEEMEQAKRYGRDFSLMLFDIDHFKKFNDTHGHQTGDMVLQQFSQLLRDNTRKSDICCRYGGEEMAVILPESRLDESAILANKLCDIIRNHPFEGMAGGKLTVTTSIGVTQYHEDFETPAEMIKAVDDVLYKAKELGRNRVELSGI